MRDAPPGPLSAPLVRAYSACVARFFLLRPLPFVSLPIDINSVPFPLTYPLLT